MIKYTKDHEWVSLDGDVATIGITSYAQKALGDVVFVELPSSGTTYSQGDEAAVVESVKAASEVYAPISGEVTEANDALEATPALVNSDPENDGWFFKMTVADQGELDDLMSEDDYQAYLADLD